MSYNVLMREEQGYLRVEVTGARVPGHEAEDAIEVTTRVADACRGKNIDKVLVIIDLSGHLPTPASYKIASDPERFGWEKRFKLALVDLNQKSRLENYTTVAIAVNQGYDMKIFDNELTAQAWLLQA
jgi:hypothetical protein